MGEFSFLPVSRMVNVWDAFKLQFIGLKPDKLLMNNEVAASG